MSNPNNPFGFQLIRAGGKQNRLEYFEKKTGAAIYPGDAVKQDADGKVVVAETDDVILGIAAEYKAATNTDKIAVITDKDAEFRVQTTADFQQTSVHQNAGFDDTAGDADLKKSKMALDSSTIAATATLPFKILGLEEVGENAFGSYAIVRVKLNHYAFASGTAGV